MANPSELYSLGDGQSGGDISRYTLNFSVFSYPLYEEVRDHTREFSEIAGFQDRLVNLSIRRSGATEIARTYNGELVSGNYFSTLGVPVVARPHASVFGPP